MRPPVNSRHWALSQAFQDFADELSRTERTVVVNAGHFCVAESLSELSFSAPAEESSFFHGTALFSTLRNNGVSAYLVLWINDIGISKQSREALRQGSSLPRSYMEILQDFGFGEDDVLVILESSMRNRASTLVRRFKNKKPHLFRKVSAMSEYLVRCVGGGPACTVDEQPSAYVIDGPEGEDLVVKEGPNPKCNFILATLFDRLAETYSPSLIVNLFNEAYTNRIAFGHYVYETIFDGTKPIKTLFCDSETGEIYL